MNEKKLELVDFLRGGAIFTIALMHLVAGSLTGTLNKMAAFGGGGCLESRGLGRLGVAGK